MALFLWMLKLSILVIQDVHRELLWESSINLLLQFFDLFVSWPFLWMIWVVDRLTIQIVKVLMIGSPHDLYVLEMLMLNIDFFWVH